MRSSKRTALNALLAALLGFFVAGMASPAVADDANSNLSRQSRTQSVPAAAPALPVKSMTADPDKAIVEPTDKLLVFGGGLLGLALAAIGLTITFRSLLGDIRDRRNRYRRRAKREPRSA